MPSSLKISIPEPCHENWSTMTPADKGRFCAACQKCVVDFTAMTDKEVKAYLNAKKGEKVCGRTSQQQLYRLNRPEEQSAPWWFKIAAGLGLAAIFSPAVGQEIPKSPIQPVPLQLADSLNTESAALSSENTVADSVKVVISGKVVDKSTKESIPFANVVLKNKEGKQVGYAMTDIEGNYKLQFYTEEGQYQASDEFVVEVLTIGYKKVEMKLIYSILKTSNLTDFLLPISLSCTYSERLIVGMFVREIDTKYNPESSLTRESIWQRVGNRLERVK